MKSFLLVSVFLLTSCAQMGTHFSGFDNKSPEGVEITQIPNPKENVMAGAGKVKIEYVSVSKLQEDAEREIKNEMLDTKTSSLKRASIPQGGRIIVHIFRDTVDSGNTKWFSYILTVNGKELIRKNGTEGVNSVPHVPSNAGGVDDRFWRNLDIVDISKSIKSGDLVQFFVVDKLSNERDEFKLVIK